MKCYTERAVDTPKKIWKNKKAKQKGKTTMKYIKEFKEEALKLSDEIRLKKLLNL